MLSLASHRSSSSLLKLARCPNEGVEGEGLGALVVDLVLEEVARFSCSLMRCGRGVGGRLRCLGEGVVVVVAGSVWNIWEVKGLLCSPWEANVLICGP